MLGRRSARIIPRSTKTEGQNLTASSSSSLNAQASLSKVASNSELTSFAAEEVSIDGTTGADCFNVCTESKSRDKHLQSKYSLPGKSIVKQHLVEKYTDPFRYAVPSTSNAGSTGSAGSGNSLTYNSTGEMHSTSTPAARSLKMSPLHEIYQRDLFCTARKFSKKSSRKATHLIHDQHEIHKGLRLRIFATSAPLRKFATSALSSRTPTSIPTPAESSFPTTKKMEFRDLPLKLFSSRRLTLNQKAIKSSNALGEAHSRRTTTTSTTSSTTERINADLKIDTSTQTDRAKDAFSQTPLPEQELHSSQGHFLATIQALPSSKNSPLLKPPSQLFSTGLNVMRAGQQKLIQRSSTQPSDHAIMSNVSGLSTPIQILSAPNYLRSNTSMCRKRALGLTSPNEPQTETIVEALHSTLFDKIRSREPPSHQDTGNGSQFSQSVEINERSPCIPQYESILLSFNPKDHRHDYLRMDSSPCDPVRVRSMPSDPPCTRPESTCQSNYIVKYAIQQSPVVDQSNIHKSSVSKSSRFIPPILTTTVDVMNITPSSSKPATVYHTQTPKAANILGNGADDSNCVSRGEFSTDAQNFETSRAPPEPLSIVNEEPLSYKSYSKEDSTRSNESINPVFIGREIFPMRCKSWSSRTNTEGQNLRRPLIQPQLCDETLSDEDSSGIDSTSSIVYVRPSVRQSSFKVYQNFALRSGKTAAAECPQCGFHLRLIKHLRDRPQSSTISTTSLTNSICNEAREDTHRNDAIEISSCFGGSEPGEPIETLNEPAVFIVQNPFDSQEEHGGDFSDVNSSSRSGWCTTRPIECVLTDRHEQAQSAALKERLVPTFPSSTPSSGMHGISILEESASTHTNTSRTLPTAEQLSSCKGANPSALAENACSPSYHPAVPPLRLVDVTHTTYDHLRPSTDPVDLSHSEDPSKDIASASTDSAIPADSRPRTGSQSVIHSFDQTAWPGECQY